MDLEKKAKVALLCSNYKSISQSIEKLVTLLDYIPKKNGIFIKPNIVGSYAANSGIVTSPKIIEALILYFKKRFPHKKIIIGDGPADPSQAEKFSKQQDTKSLRIIMELRS